MLSFIGKDLQVKERLGESLSGGLCFRSLERISKLRRDLEKAFQVAYAFVHWKGSSGETWRKSFRYSWVFPPPGDSLIQLLHLPSWRAAFCIIVDKVDSEDHSYIYLIAILFGANIMFITRTITNDVYTADESDWYDKILKWCTSRVWHMSQTLSPRGGMMQYISGAVE